MSSIPLAMAGGRRRSMAGSEFSLPPDGAEAAALLDDMVTVPVEISFGAPALRPPSCER